MTEYRAPRVWHIEERFGRFYVVNHFGGFEGWHNERADAVRAGLAYVETYGDLFESPDACEMVSDGTDTNGDEWNRCTTHGQLVLGDAYVCEGYTAPAYEGGH